MKTMKRLLAMLLVLSMLLSNLPVAALAEELAAPVAEETIPETTEAPVEMPTEAPTETPAEAPTEAPAEIPAEVPTEAPAEAPTEAPAEVPEETLAYEREAADSGFIAESAYLSYGHVGDYGNGFVEEGFNGETDMGLMPGQEHYVIFYLNYFESEDAEELTSRPVHVQVAGEGSLNLNPISADRINPDAENGEYFYAVSTDTWEQEVKLETVLEDGTAIGGVTIWTYRFGACAYSSMEMSNETCVVTPYQVNLQDLDAFELYVGLDTDWNAESFTLEWGGDSEIWLEDTDNSNVKRVRLHDSAIDGLKQGETMHYSVRVEGQGYADYANFAIEADPSTIPHDPYLTFDWLDNNDKGWYENGNPTFQGYNIMPGQEYYHIYYLNEWNADLGDYEARPVHVQTDGDLNLERIDSAYVLPGQENDEYFYAITVNSWNQEIDLYTVLEDGTKVYGVTALTYPEPVWIYTSMEAGIDTIVCPEYMVDMTEGADNELYVVLTDSYWGIEGGNFWVDDYCTDIIYLEETGDANIRRICLTEDAMRMLSNGEYLWIGIGVNTVVDDNIFFANIGLVPDPDTISHDPYLTIGWLEDWGEGLFEPEDHYGDGMGPLPGEVNNVIFYFHEWNEDDNCYYERPVHVKVGEGSIHLNRIRDNIAEDQENSEYFYEMTVDNWDEAVEVYYELEDGTRVSFWGWTGRHEMGFYSAPEMSNVTWCGHRPFEIDPFGTNTVYFGLNSDWATVKDLWTHDWANDYVNIERINEYVYSITLTQDGINQNMGQYLLGIPVCLDIVDNNDPNHVEYRETNIDFSRMELEGKGFFQINYETYEIIDGGYVHGWPTGEFDENGPIWMYEVTDHLPEGASYDLDSNRLTLENFHGESLFFGYRYFDEWLGEYVYNLPSDNLTIELIGENSLVSNEDIALNIFDELNAEIVGDGSLYIKAVNHEGNIHEDGTPRSYPAVHIDGGDLTFRDNVDVTVEIAGSAMEGCWDENGYMGDRPAHLIAINAPGEKDTDISLHDNATLTTVVPKNARANGPTLDWEDPCVFWGDRNPGGYGGMQGFNSLNIHGGTLNTQGISLAWNPDNGDASYYNQFGGTVNIDSIGYYHSYEEYNEETDQMEIGSGFFYVGLDGGVGCEMAICGGTLNIDTTPDNPGENAFYEPLSIIGGELNISGGQINLMGGGNEGNALWIGGWFNENTQQLSSSTWNMSGGELNIQLDSYNGAAWLTSDSKANLTGGVINADNGSFNLRGAVLFDGTVLNANNSWIEMSNESAINSGEINMLEGFNSIEFNGMIEMNGGSINLAMADVYVNNGFHFNGGEINIDNTAEVKYKWSAFAVNTYFAICGDAQLNIHNALNAPAMRISGTFHQMGGIVNIDHSISDAMAVHVLSYEDDEQGLVSGTMLLNEGEFNIRMPEGMHIDGLHGVWVDENAVLFMGAQPEEEGGKIRPDQIPVMNLENADLMIRGVVDLKTNAVLNVENAFVDFQGSAELIMDDNAKFNVKAFLAPEMVDPEIWTCLFHTGDDSSVSVDGDSVLNIQAENFHSAAIINGRFVQDGGTVNISNFDKDNRIEGEGCFHINGNGKVIIRDGEMNLSGTDTGIGLDTAYERKDGATLTISGGDINIDVDRLAMYLTASTRITGGNFDIDVAGYVTDAMGPDGSVTGELLYAQGIYINGYDNPDAKLTITGGNFDIRVEKDGEDYDVYNVNGIYVMRCSADITGGTFHLSGAEVNFFANDPAHKMNIALAAYSMNTGKLLEQQNYVAMFDEEGIATNDPEAAAIIFYGLSYEEDNVPGDYATGEGMDYAKNLVLISNKAGGNVTWKAENGILKFSGVGGMYDYAPAAPAPWTALSDFIHTVEMDSNLKKIGSYAFNGLKKLTTLDFLGNPPEFAENALYGVVADAFHLIGNENWTADKMKDYGGKITWIQHYAHEALTALETDKDMLLAGQTATLTATVTPNLDPELEVIWELAEGDKDYVTLKVNKDHTATITAKKNTQYRDVLVTAYVRGSAAEPLRLKIAVLPVVTKVGIRNEDGKDITGTTYTLYMGSADGMQLQAVNEPVGSYQNVTWTSSNTKQVTVDENGYVTALVAGKTVTITATANDGSGKKATVKIKTMIPVENIELSGSEVCAAGKTITLTAAVSPANAGNKKLAWEIIEGKEYATISNGKLKAAKTVDSQQTVVVRVSSMENPEVYELYTVIVYPATTAVVIKVGEQNVTGKTVDFTMSSDAEENVLQLIAQSDPAEAAQQWTWKSSSDKLATVDEDGQVTLLQAGKTVTITVTANDGTGKKATVKIKTTQPMEEIALSGPAVAAAGKTISLTANIYPENTTNKKLVWSVDGEGATVSNGKLKVGKTVEDGTVVTVRAAWAENPEEVYGEWDVTLYQTAATKVEIQDADGKALTGTLVLDMGTENPLDLYAQVQPDVAAQDVIWTSSNVKQAVVSEDGVVTVLVPGKVVTITATAADGSGKKATLKVKGVQLMEELNLREDQLLDEYGNLILAGGKSLKLATAVEILPATTSNQKLEWSVECEDPNVKINKSSGVLSTKKVSEMVTATVSATALDGSGTELSFDVSIYPATTKVTIRNGGKDVTGTTLTAPVGARVPLVGQSEPANAANVYTWTPSNTAQATVDADGTVTLLDAVGKTVTITGTAVDGTNKKATVKIKIVEAPQEPPELTENERAEAEAEIRYAISLLIDRNMLSDGQIPASSFVAMGMTDADGSQFYQNAGGNDYAGYWDTSDKAYASNCKKAMDILKKYYDVDADGKLIDFPVLTYIYNEGSGHKYIAECIQSVLGKYGIQIEKEEQEWNTMLYNRQKGEYDLARHGWLADYNDPMNMLDMWTSYSGNNDAQLGKGDHAKATMFDLDLTPWGYNINVKNGTWAETYDVLISVIKSCGRDSVRYELMHLAEDLLMESGCIVPLYYYVDGYLLSNSVKGFGTNPSGLKFFQCTTVNAQADSISVCMGPEPDTMDPALSTTSDTASILTHLFSGLAKWAPDASGSYNRIVADCAEELVAPVLNADGTVTYTYTLKDGLTWSDGVALTARDFEFAWKRAASTELGAGYGYMFEQIKGYPDNLAVKATDDKTLRVTLNSNISYWNELLAFITFMPVREDVVSNEMWATSAQTYVSNGAYTMTGWAHDSQIVLSKNATYWDAENIIMKEIRFLSNIDLQRAWENRTLHFLEGSYEDFYKNHMSEYYITPALGTYFLVFNANTPLLP